MKHFVLAILAAAVIPVFSGCASSGKAPDTAQAGTADQQEKTLKAAISREIEDYMKKYDASVESRPCQFSCVGAETVFRDIPFISQQKDIPYQTYRLEDLGSKQIIQCTLAREYKMKQVRQTQDGKITGVLILNDRKVFISPDGKQYKQVTEPLMVNAMRFHYDLAMNLDTNIRKVAVETVDTYKLDPKTTAWSTMQEPVEILIDNERCYRLDMLLQTNDYAAKIEMYIKSDDRQPIRMIITPVSGLPRECGMTILMSDFRLSKDSFLFPFKITLLKDPKKQIQLRKTRLSVSDAPFDPKFFSPEGK